MLHKIPSELNFTEEQWIELVAYNRIKGKIYNTCKRCNEKERRKPKTCFWCGSHYTEDGSVVGPQAFNVLDNMAN